MFEIRENDRCGKFLANSSIGNVIIEIDISGFGEEITVYTESDKFVLCVNSLNENDFYEEYDNKIIFHNVVSVLSDVEIYKPFSKT